TNMTESLAALRALCGIKGNQRDATLAAFYERWKNNPLVIDKWFAVQALSGDPESVKTLAAHPDYDLANPNRVRAIAGVFAAQNLSAFHAPDGSGHELVADIIARADKRNPALAARIAMTFEQWRKLEPKSRGSAERVLKQLQAGELSQNTADIIGRALG
ncbi:MAG: aminopeptidase N C-terminal domain-containing protein, partial [Hyphomonadaceae bacterium]